MTTTKNNAGRKRKAWAATLLAAGAAFGLTGAASAQETMPVLAQEALPIALTAAPPAETFSIFNPSHLYLNNGSSTISASKGTVSASGWTSATVTADSIGVIYYFQKYNGSSWENVGSASTTGGNNLTTYSSSASKAVTAGYYYRVRTIHWVIENGVYEEGEYFSNSVLGL